MPIGPWELATLLVVLGGPVLLAILFVIFLIFFRSRSNPNKSADQSSALRILDERYARGEIDADEYEERRRHLVKDRNP